MMSAWVGPAIIATIISLIFGVLRENYFDGKRRRERMMDIQIALLAEIRAYVAVLVRDRLAEYAPYMVGRMLADTKFVPFIPSEKNDTVFQSILPNIHILPESSIDPVVVYYSQLVAISEMARDMRRKVYAGLSAARRIDIFQNYIAMKQQALVFGQEAECMLDTFIRRGEEGVAQFLNERRAAEMSATKADVKQWLSNPALAPCDHQ